LRKSQEPANTSTTCIFCCAKKIKENFMEKVKKKKAFDSRDLGTEKIGKLLRMFAIPCVLALVIQALYNIVDQLFIGNSTLGELGNTATGLIYPLTVIAYSIGQCIGDGTASCMSINQGRGDNQKTHKSVGTSLVFGTILSLILMGVCFGILKPFLNFLQAGDAFDFAKDYSTWIFIGFPLYVIGTIINPIIRADGSPKYAMLAIASGAIVNIILDPIFIFACNMGMNGAALATFIGQAATFALSVGYLFKTKTFKLKAKSFVPDFKLFYLTIKLGISSFLTQISIAIISTVTNIILGKRVATGELGTGAVGFLTIAFKIFGIVISVAIGIACGGQPILGYNYGAKNYDRVKKTYKLIMLVTLIVGVVATLIFELCPQYLLKMFGSKNLDAFSTNIFRIYLCTILLTCITKAHSIFFQAIGQPAKSMTIAMCRDLIFLVPLTIVFPIVGGINLFLWSAPVSDVLTMIVTIIFVVMFFKKLKKQETTHEVLQEISQKAVIQNSKAGVIVTISRQHGAGGREIGKKLAERLGVPFYDKEIAMLTAKDSGLAAEFVENIDQTNSALYSLYLSADANANAISAQNKVLNMIADKGSCVIVGRAADYVLSGRENLFKVFVYAPIEYKIERVMKNYGDDEKTARENIEKSDKRRAKFYKDVTGQDWANSENYNLCVDGSVGVEAIVDMICDCLDRQKATKQ
jgi:putative MATE family efflux protein